MQETIILSDGINLLSPALGFHEDVALVTVSIIERTQDKRLRSQPYLVTSDRKLYRLDTEQILALNGKEIALRVIPEASEFLMRWRIGDIQRFVEGEAGGQRSVDWASAQAVATDQSCPSQTSCRRQALCDYTSRGARYDAPL